MKTTYIDEDYTLYPKDGGGSRFDTKEGVYEDREWRDIQGLIKTHWGFVDAFSSYEEGTSQTSTLAMIKDGRVYYRDFNKAFSQRGLVTKAKEFARELHS